MFLGQSNKNENTKNATFFHFQTNETSRQKNQLAIGTMSSTRKSNQILSTYPSSAQFKNNINIVLIFKKAMKSHNMNMVQAFVNGDFLAHFLLLMRLQKQTFGNNFACIDNFCGWICQFVAFCKSSLKNSFIK